MPALGLLCLVGFGHDQAETGEDAPSAVKQTSERTAAVGVESQKAVDAWAAEEKELLEKIDRHERALKRMAWERKKTSEYLETLESKMADLREKADQMKRINAELLPILDQVLERLTACVRDDFPFDRAGRLDRMADAALEKGAPWAEPVANHFIKKSYPSSGR